MCVCVGACGAPTGGPRVIGPTGNWAPTIEPRKKIGTTDTIKT